MELLHFSACDVNAPYQRALEAAKIDPNYPNDRLPTCHVTQPIFGRNSAFLFLIESIHRCEMLSQFRKCIQQFNIFP